MIDFIKEELGKDKQPPEVDALLEYCKVRIKRSRSAMSRCYSDWDRQDEVFRGEIMPDKDDKKNANQGKPIKMIVPNTYAQVMSFVSFLFLMFNQNTTFYQLTPSGPEDASSKRKDCENVLERDLKRNQWNLLLFQHLLDIAKFGCGVLETSWTRQYTNVFVTPQPQIINVAGIQTPVQSEGAWKEFLKFEGNHLRAVSPYQWLPDTSRPITEFQRGEFCAAEETYSMTQLREMERLGEVHGVDYIEPLPDDLDNSRGGQTRTVVMAGMDNFIKDKAFSAQNGNHNALVTKVQIWIIPSKFKWSGDKTLGPEEFPILHHIWYANDNRVIRIEPAGWWHNEFGFSAAQFTPDMHRTMNSGLANLIEELQSVISWFVNSHISSVRRVMQNRLIVDPRIINTATLDGESDIYLRSGVSVPNLERAVGQLRVQDVTGSHMSDTSLLEGIMEKITGVNGNAMGQYATGRRSAQESRVVTAGAAGRLKMHGHLIWESSLGRQGRLMLSNSRQELSMESFKWITGEGDIDPTTGQSTIQDRFAKFKATPEEIICGDDFMVFDSTLQSEKGFVAQSIQELLSVLIQANPMVAMQFGQRIDPSKLLDEMFYLRGSGNVSRFAYDPGKAPMMPQPAMMPPAGQPAAV